MGQSDPPKSPNPAKSYEQEIAIYLQNLPALLQAEQDARTTYDPQRIAEQQALEAQFGPTQYQQQLDALQQLDPQGTQIRSDLGDAVSSDLEATSGLRSNIISNATSDLAYGYSLPSGLEEQLNNEIRGAQVARGNTQGNAAVSAEALFKGQNLIADYQRRLGNATGVAQTAIDNTGQFAGLASPIQQISQIQPVQPDQSSVYTNPSAGFAGQNFALANYGNQLGAYNAQTAQGNSWARALSGAASGAAAGGGGWGSVIDGVAGGVGGYYSDPNYVSDRRLKENIIPVGVSPAGHRTYEFDYHNSVDPTSTRYRGVMAQDILETCPEAVSRSEAGWLLVNYDKLDVPFEVVTDA